MTTTAPPVAVNTANTVTTNYMDRKAVVKFTGQIHDEKKTKSIF